MERWKFKREFKLEAVRLIKDRGVSYVQASQDLNVYTSHSATGSRSSPTIRSAPFLATANRKSDRGLHLCLDGGRLAVRGRRSD